MAKIGPLFQLDSRYLFLYLPGMFCVDEITLSDNCTIFTLYQPRLAEATCARLLYNVLQWLTQRHNNILFSSCKETANTKYLKEQYEDLVLGFYMIYPFLHCECQLHYRASSRASYYQQGKYIQKTYNPSYCSHIGSKSQIWDKRLSQKYNCL